MSIISCHNLTKKFGNKVVLNNINFTIQTDDVVALIGPNGAGKTTLFSILAGYIFADTGELSILNLPLGNSKLFGQLAVLPQDAELDPKFSVAKQLRFYAQLQGFTASNAKVEVERVLALVDLADALNLKPSELSHGMKKRVAIAQALMGAPKVVLLDEPTAGLDPHNAMQIRKLISQLSSHCCFIISSHNLAELERLCNKVLFLNNGSLTENNFNNADDELQTLTLVLAKNNSIEITELVEGIEGVVTVEITEKNRYRVMYNPNIAKAIEPLILQTLIDNNVNYQQIIRGKTLEESLFE